jgi:hypothetical protein
MAVSGILIPDVLDLEVRAVAALNHLMGHKAAMALAWIPLKAQKRNALAAGQIDQKLNVLAAAGKHAGRVLLNVVPPGAAGAEIIAQVLRCAESLKVDVIDPGLGEQLAELGFGKAAFATDWKIADIDHHGNSVLLEAADIVLRLALFVTKGVEDHV